MIDDSYEVQEEDLFHEPILGLWTKDEKVAAATLGVREVRFLVDAYYSAQQNRIDTNGQIRSGEGEEPNLVLVALARQASVLEKRIKAALQTYVDGHKMGPWLKSIYGIGPVISAGLLAHIDVSNCNTASRIWRFAGLDPTVVWEKGQKRPWNARLKVLCWKAATSFVKFSGREECFYGQQWCARKAWETQRNESGALAAAAALALERHNYRKDTGAKTAYESGKLPPAHVHARSMRWTVKLFLSHYHEVAYFHETGALPPAPYAIGVQGHADYIQVPNLEVVPGLLTLKKQAGQDVRAPRVWRPMGT